MSVIQISHIIAEHKHKIYKREGKPPEFSLKSLPSINNRIWGFNREKMVVIGGRPGNFKSGLLLQLAYDFASQEHTVYFFSFEMAPGVCAERLIANHCNIDNFNLSTGKLAGKEKVEIDRFQDKISKMNLHIFNRIGQTLPSFNAILNEIHGKPDIVMVDYGNLVKETKGQKKKDAYDEYIKGLRALAIRNNFCVIMGAQINRQVAFRGKIREPGLEDLKDTGELEQTADMVILLHYPWHHTHREEDRGKFTIKIAKNRDGRTGYQDCKILPHLCRVAEVEK